MMEKKAHLSNKVLSPKLALSSSIMLMSIMISACNPSSEETIPQDNANVEAAPKSIVVLGDSVASGEGINYGYTYSYHPFNRFSHWTGGVTNPVWEGPYQLCHDSKLAYGNIVASQLGATLAKFACTGSTYDNGLIFDRNYAGKVYRPAQFGDWLTQSGLNTDYDRAKPDVVVLTFGADDVSFVDVVTFCATGYTSSDTAAVDALASAENPRAEIRKNFLERYPTIETLEANKASETDIKEDVSASNYCTAANPGAPIETLFWGPIRSGQIANQYKQMVQFIQARGIRAGKIPHIVFTTYHNPLPKPGQPIDCYDLGDLSQAEIDYLNTLEATLDSTIKNAVGHLPGVTIADISQVMNGHRWCTKDPWTYGLSVLALNSASQAPFHPTPQGQLAISKIVAGAIPK